MGESFASQGIYNIKAVAEITGIPVERLRAWELRYGFPDPQRSDNNYRLYSDQDVQALHWLKSQVDKGLSIRHAVALLRERGLPGASNGSNHLEYAPVTALRPSFSELREAFYAQISALQEVKAEALIKGALATYPLELVFNELFVPVLVRVGDGWHSGQLPIAVEHLCSQLLRTSLLGILDKTLPPARSERVLAACAPGETHELGLLMLVVLLRQAGYPVIYFGTDLTLERIEEVLALVKPRLILFSATLPENAQRLAELRPVLQSLPAPRPLIGLGGRAFRLQPELLNQLPGTLLGPRVDTAVAQIETLLTPLEDPL